MRRRFGRSYELLVIWSEFSPKSGTADGIIGEFWGERMNQRNADRRDTSLALQHSAKALDLMQKTTLTPAEQDEVVADCVENFNRYVNPGILEYRKSVSTDYTAVEWSDGGATFTDIHGNEFIDCLGGFGIYMLGHRHPTVMKAVLGQLRHQALHSQELLDPMRGYLAELVAMVTPGDLQYSFLVNSGTEATEGALKFAKVYAYEKKPDHMLGTISTTRAFHGKSMGSLSVSGKREFRVPFQPLMPGSRFVPYGDADAIDRELGICDMIGYDIAAFIVEPVQGEAGAIVPPDDYLPKVREICDKWDVVLIADEVQTGMGRTGKLWGVDNWGVAPDIMTMGKAFGGAVIPCGNIVVTERIFSAMFENPYLHTTTFGGNPVATAAAIGALHATLEEDIPRQAAEKGAYLKERVTQLAGEYEDLYDEVRGLGLLLGMEFKTADIGYAVSAGLFAEGVLVGGTLNNAKTLRLEPPAVISYQQLDTVVERLGDVLAGVRRHCGAREPAPA
jgi:putrescine aminotransferase